MAEDMQGFCMSRVEQSGAMGSTAVQDPLSLSAPVSWSLEIRLQWGRECMHRTKRAKNKSARVILLTRGTSALLLSDALVYKIWAFPKVQL